MSDLEILIQEIARVALNHGSLSLGDYTLRELIGNDLDVSDEELDRVAGYLDELTKGE